MIKRSLAVALVLVSILATVPVTAQTRPAPTTTRKPVRYGIAFAPGDAVPAFTGSDLGGKPFEVAYDGPRATIVGFWSSACVPCRIQSVTLQKLFAQQHDAGVQVVGVAADTGPMNVAPTAARAYLEETGGTYPVVRSTPEIETAWRGVTILPMTFLVGRDGKLLRRYVGADVAIMNGLVEDVAAYLAGRPLGDQPFPESPSEAPPAGGAGVPPR